MTDYVKEFRKKVSDFKRELVRVELRKRTKKQIDLFNRMYKSIDKIKEDDMPWAYAQIKESERKEVEKALQAISDETRM